MNWIKGGVGRWRLHKMLMRGRMNMCEHRASVERTHLTRG